MEDDLMVAMRREYEVLARPGGIDFAAFKRLMRKVSLRVDRWSIATLWSACTGHVEWTGVCVKSVKEWLHASAP